MSWLYLALLASMLWAVVQLVDKTLVHAAPGTPNHYLIVTGVVSVVPVAVLVPTLLAGGRSPTPGVAAAAVGAGVCYFGSNAAYFRALIHVDASLTAAALATLPALTTVGSWLILGQHLPALAIAGVAAIATGVAVMSESAGGPARPPGRAWALLVLSLALRIGEYLLEARAVESASAATVFAVSRLGVLLCLVGLTMANRRQVAEALAWAFRRSRRVGLLTVANESLDMAAAGALIAAFSHSPAGLATAVASTPAAFVFVITLGVNRIRPGTIPTDVDRASSVAWRTIGLLIVLIGVFLSAAKH